MSKERQKRWLVSMPLEFSFDYRYFLTADSEDEAREKFKKVDLQKSLIDRGVGYIIDWDEYIDYSARKRAEFTEAPW